VTKKQRYGLPLLIWTCAPKHTMTIKKELQKQEITTFCPVENVKRRLPRTKKTISVWQPVLPGFIFTIKLRTDVEMIKDLSSTRLIPECRPMIINGEHAVTLGSEIYEMNKASQDSQDERSPNDHGIPLRALVEIASGPFSGYTGTVHSVVGDYVELLVDAFPDRPFKIRPFLLRVLGV
jgi:transcription antitermination factor NusG